MECRGWYISLSVSHICEQYKNDSTDRVAVWGADLGGHKEPCIRCGQGHMSPYAAMKGEKQQYHQIL